MQKTRSQSHSSLSRSIHLKLETFWDFGPNSGGNTPTPPPDPDSKRNSGPLISVKHFVSLIFLTLKLAESFWNRFRSILLDQEMNFEKKIIEKYLFSVEKFYFEKKYVEKKTFFSQTEKISKNVRKISPHCWSDVAAFGWIDLQGGMILLIQFFFVLQCLYQNSMEKLFGRCCKGL